MVTVYIFVSADNPRLVKNWQICVEKKRRKNPLERAREHNVDRLHIERLIRMFFSPFPFRYQCRSLRSTNHLVPFHSFSFPFQEDSTRSLISTHSSDCSGLNEVEDLLDDFLALIRERKGCLPFYVELSRGSSISSLPFTESCATLHEKPAGPVLVRN